MHKKQTRKRTSETDSQQTTTSIWNKTSSSNLYTCDNTKTWPEEGIPENVKDNFPFNMRTCFYDQANTVEEELKAQKIFEQVCKLIKGRMKVELLTIIMIIIHRHAKMQTESLSDRFIVLGSQPADLTVMKHCIISFISITTSISLAYITSFVHYYTSLIYLDYYYYTKLSSSFVDAWLENRLTILDN